MSSTHDDNVYLAIRGGEPPQADWPEAGLLLSVYENPSAASWCATARHLADRGLIRAASGAFMAASGMAALAASNADIYDHWAEALDRYGYAEQAETRRRVARRLRGAVDPGRLVELEAESGWVVCKVNDPQGFAALLAALPVRPLADDPLRGDGPILSVLDVSDFVGARQDYSFVVADEDGASLLVVCDVVGAGMMVRGEAAVQITRLRPQVADWAVQLALAQLAYLTRWSGADRVLVEDDGSPPVNLWFSELPHQVTQAAYCEIDLAQSMDTIRRAYRETHRQQVAWGRKHLRVEKLADPASLYDGFTELYHTGNRLTPQFTPESLGQDGISLFAAWSGDQLASVVVASDFGTTAYYTAGARMPGSKSPLTHVLIDTAIADAQSRGMARFSFGRLHLDVSDDDKLHGIAGFKRGFATDLRHVRWIAVKP